MIELSSAAIEWISGGVLIALAGWLIKYRGWTFLVAGYDTTSSVSEEVIGDIVGTTVLRVGIATAALGVLMTGTPLPATLRTLFGVLVLLAVFRMLYRIRTQASGANTDNTLETDPE